MAVAETKEDEVLFERLGHAGIVTLNRPKALNAISHAMVRAMTVQLTAWAVDDGVRTVIIRASGGRAFSAGGDIRHLYEWGRGKDPRFLAFYVDEYRLDAMIAQYPTPYVALIDGIVMGGGAGVSINGSHRVGSQTLQFAMPEVGIGFFPDVGATYFVPRLGGVAGPYLALTGERIGPADALDCGLLEAVVPQTAFGDVIDRLSQDDDVDATLDRFRSTPEGGSLSERLKAVAPCFKQPDVEALLAALEMDGGPEALKTHETIRQKSPTSLKIAFRQMREGAALDIEAALQLEYRIVSRVRDGHDFYEGIRAAVVDKDRTPRWVPARLEDVRETDVDAYFQPLPDGDLTFPGLTG